jgi:hypothetical protein
MIKGYVHASSELLKTELIKTGSIPKEKKVLVRNDKGEMEEKDLDTLKFTKGELFSFSAGFLLFSDVGKYVCTHMPDKLNGKSLWYYEITLPFDDFVRMAIGEEGGFFIEMTGEKRSIYHELKQRLYVAFSAGEQKCFMKEKDGKLVYDAPFRWGLETEDDKEFLSAGMVKKLANIDHKKIKNIRLSLHKAIFGKFVEGSRFFSISIVSICKNLHAAFSAAIRHHTSPRKNRGSRTSALRANA